MSFLEEIEERSLAAYRSKGLKARPYMFIPLDGACCAIGAIIHNDTRYDVAKTSFCVVSDVAKTIGLEYDDLVQFTLGFDMALDSCREAFDHELSDRWFASGYAVGHRLIAEGLCAEPYPRRRKP